MPLPNEHYFKFFSDPAHGWLEMPSELVKELNAILEKSYKEHMENKNESHN